MTLQNNYEPSCPTIRVRIRCRFLAFRVVYQISKKFRVEGLILDDDLINTVTIIQEKSYFRL